MAIQKRKAPSPSTIKNSPQSFTKEELNQLKELRVKTNQLVGQFGQLHINQIKLENLKKQLTKELSKKYGDGSIDLETGTFTPTK